MNVLKRRKPVGRYQIFTDYSEINENNIAEVLEKAMLIHFENARQIDKLIDFEAGIQPLPYKKKIRSDINIKTTDNMANYVTEFNKGYFWGIPPMFTQRGNKEHHNTDETADSFGISGLNEMLSNGVCIGQQNQILADFEEKGGVCPRYINRKMTYTEKDKFGTYIDYYTLDPRTAFCVYYSGIGHTKLLGVTFRDMPDGSRMYTCFTDRMRYEVKRGEKKPVWIGVNPLGRIPIVEHVRSIDRSGCFERVMDLCINLNSMVTNFANDVAQKTQEIWWGNDIDFPKDEKGNPIKPESGQWLLTYTGGEGNNPKIQPMSSTFDSTPTLDAIETTRNEILKKCFVPLTYDSSGGGSTGVATDSAAGWSAASIAANAKEQLEQGAMREELDLILRAIALVPTDILPEDDPMRSVHLTDVNVKFTRNKSYDMSSKANTLATLLAHGINGQHAIEIIDLFNDPAQVWEDSKEGIKKFQEYTYDNKSEPDSVNGRIMQDNSDQAANSPLLDGTQTQNKAVS